MSAGGDGCMYDYVGFEQKICSFVIRIVCLFGICVHCIVIMMCVFLFLRNEATLPNKGFPRSEKNKRNYTAAKTYYCRSMQHRA